MEDPLGVGHDDVVRIDSQLDEEAGGGDARRPGAGDNDGGHRDVAACQLEGVEKGGSSDDGRAVLIVVEHGDVEAVPESLLDIEALGGLDVLEIDPANGGCQELAELDDVVGLGSVDLEIEHIDVGKSLEEDGLALHDGLARQGSDVPQSEDCRPVGDNGDEIASIGVAKGCVGIIGDDQAGLGHTRGVGEAQVGLGRSGFGCPDGELAGGRLLVIVQGF